MIDVMTLDFVMMVFMDKLHVKLVMWIPRHIDDISKMIPAIKSVAKLRCR